MSGIFERVVCGVDDSEAGHLAARLAVRLTEPDGSLTLVAVEDTSIAVHAGWQMAAVSHQLAGEARAALAHGRELGEAEHPITPRLLRGDPVNGLLAEIDRREASLIVVGTHEFGRGVGIALRLGRDPHAPRGDMLGADRARSTQPRAVAELDRGRP